MNPNATITNAQQPFVILERASPSKLCANVGSGYDIAPTAIHILRDRLGLDIDTAFHRYAGMSMCDQDAGVLRDLRFASVNYEAYMADRSVMQSILLESLLGDDWKEEVEKNDETGPATKKKIFCTQDGHGTLRCGVTLSGYQESEDSVTVTLDDGTEVVGSALLACDGIHSQVRRSLMETKDDGVAAQDEFHFCNTHCWWGKAEIPPGSDLETLVKKTQPSSNRDDNDNNISFVWALGSNHRPGAFMGAPRGLGTNHQVYLWSLFRRADAPPSSKSNDLTRRGGSVLTEESKASLLNDTLRSHGKLVTELVRATPAHAVTHVGLWDRQNLDLPWSSDRVALLGDAAHPQSPFAGQGVNMAVTDAHVLTTRLLLQSRVRDAVQAYDTDQRRQGVNRVIREARSRTNMSLSEKGLMNWAFKMFAKYAPTSMLLNDAVEYDRSNAECLKKLIEEEGIKKGMVGAA